MSIVHHKTPHMYTKYVLYFPCQVACGLNHTLAASADGNTLWAFGDGDYGKLGLGSSTAKTSPQVVEALSGIGIRKVCCGTQFSVVLMKDGRLFSFGQGEELNDGSLKDSFPNLLCVCKYLGKSVV